MADVQADVEVRADTAMWDCAQCLGLVDGYPEVHLYGRPDGAYYAYGMHMEPLLVALDDAPRGEWGVGVYELAPRHGAEKTAVRVPARALHKVVAWAGGVGRVVHVVETPTDAWRLDAHALERARREQERERAARRAEREGGVLA